MMKFKIVDADILTLNNLKGKMLMKLDTGRLYCIMDFTTAEESVTVVKKRGFWKKTSTETIVKQLYLTGANVHAWHSQGKFLGTLSDESAEWLLRRDLYRLRQAWTDFCDQLKAFGFKIVEIETKEPGTAEDMQKAAQSHLKEFFRKEGYENEQDIIKYAVSFANSLK